MLACTAPLAAYAFKRPPQPHQLRCLELSYDKPSFALLMEPRCRKSKVIIDNAALLFEQGKIDALIIVAMPGRVHRNWVAYEMAADLPDRIPYDAVSWDAAKSTTKGFLASLEFLLLFKGLAVLTVNGEAAITPRFRAYLKRFLDRRRAMVVIDESTLVCKSPSTARSKVMHAVARHPHALYRRILDGTPVGEGPLDLFSQFKFLDPAILGFTSFFAFKHRYAKWKTQTNYAAGRTYEELDRGKDGTDSPYINIDELKAKIATYSFRTTRRELGRAQEKVYQIHSFQLTKVQRRVYDELVERYETELRNEGGTLQAHHALTRLLRLQMIASNFWPSEKIAALHPPCDGEGCSDCDDLGVTLTDVKQRIIDADDDPRRTALREVLELNLNTPTIVWARFHHDVDAACAVAAGLGLKPVRYDGRCSSDDKDAAQLAFQEGKATPLVGNPRSGGRGVRLDRARLIVYYSNEFSLLSRLQSEDRAEDLDKQEATGVVDLVAEDTVDDLLILPALRAKKSIADYVMGERGGKWL